MFIGKVSIGVEMFLGLVGADTPWGGLVLIFLLVPALNLCAMISTRMKNRLPEMGICKAFGADRGRLLRQILIENLILTCLGGCWAYVGSGRY